MNINDVVVLKVDIPQENLKKGMHGVIVSIFENPDIAYELEFCDDSGKTIAEIALKPDQFDAVHAAN